MATQRISALQFPAQEIPKHLMASHEPYRMYIVGGQRTRASGRFASHNHRRKREQLRGSGSGRK